MTISQVGSPPERFSAPIQEATFDALCESLADSDFADQHSWGWLEKARRFAEMNRGNVAEKCVSRGMSKDDARHLCGQLAELLVHAGTFDDSKSIVGDLPSLNAALILLDGPDVTRTQAEDLRRRIQPTLRALPAAMALRGESWAKVAAPASDDPGSIYTVRDPQRWAEFKGIPDKVPGARVVVVSPNPYSLYTLAVMGMLLQSGVEISGLIVRSLWSVGRIREELNFGRHRLTSKVIRKLILRTDESSTPSEYGMRALCDEIGVTHRSAVKWAKELGIPTSMVQDLNAAQTHRSLDRMKPDYGLFTGGGIVRPATLERFGGGLLNCHPGILPQYRGVDVAHWPLIEGHPGQVGATAYIMDAGVDTGEILGQMFLDPTEYDDHGSLRNGLVSLKSVFLVDVLMQLISGRLHSVRQPESGRLYFSMHRSLEEMMDVASRAASCRE